MKKYLLLMTAAGIALSTSAFAGAQDTTDVQALAAAKQILVADEQAADQSQAADQQANQPVADGSQNSSDDQNGSDQGSSNGDQDDTDTD